MTDFSIGDRVRRLHDSERIPAGTPGTVGGGSHPDWRTVQFDNGVVITVDRTDLTPHVDEFPIAADDDPWRESEPNRNGRQDCCDELHGLFGCTRAVGHVGHHVARDAELDGNVHDRWPQGAPLQYGKLNLADSYDGAPLSPGKVHQVGPDGNLRWVDPTALSGDLGGPTPKYEFTEAFVQKLARALHDYDMEPVALRLEDRCDARNDKAAVLERMWRDRTTPEKKAEYAWVAAILLRRTKELP